MKALVLTYDRNRCVTNHMIHKYRQLWPDNPFVFRIPYQENEGTGQSNREYIKSPVDIKGTVLELLSGIEEDEWIYWCADDKYPIALDLPGVQSVMEFVQNIDDTTISGVLFCRPREFSKQKNLTGEVLQDSNGMKYLERSNYKRIWLHQFLRVKVLKYMFESFPDVIPASKHLDYLKSDLPKPDDHRLFVTTRNLAVFGESTAKGVLTDNCYRSILEAGLDFPDWHSGDVEKEQIIGSLPGPRSGSLLGSFFRRG